MLSTTSATRPRNVDRIDLTAFDDCPLLAAGRIATAPRSPLGTGEPLLAPGSVSEA